MEQVSRAQIWKYFHNALKLTDDFVSTLFIYCFWKLIASFFTNYFFHFVLSFISCLYFQYLALLPILKIYNSCFDNCLIFLDAENYLKHFCLLNLIDMVNQC